MDGGTFELPGGIERRPETGGRGETHRRGAERLTLGPGLGVIDAAHLGLTERFEAVARALEGLHESPHGVRETHALRVATRRAAAALLVFGPHVDAARAKRARRDLRELRRAAGAVRACDVQEELLTAAERGTPDASGVVTADEAGVVAAELMLGRVQRWREKARRGLVEARREYRPAKARRAGEKLSRSAHMALGRVDGGGAPAFRMVGGASTAGDAARAAVGVASLRFWEAVRHAEGSGDALGAGGEFGALHEMRLAGKRLRYVVEVMSNCLDEETGEAVVSMLRKLQDRLGEVNDRHELAKRTQDAAAELGLSGGLAGGKTARAFVSLRESLVASRDALLDDFEAWWEGKRRKLGIVLARLAQVSVVKGSECRPVGAPDHGAASPGVPPASERGLHPRQRTGGPSGLSDRKSVRLLARELDEAMDNARSLIEVPCQDGGTGVPPVRVPRVFDTGGMPVPPSSTLPENGTESSLARGASEENGSTKGGSVPCDTPPADGVIVPGDEVGGVEIHTRTVSQPRQEATA